MAKRSTNPGLALPPREPHVPAHRWLAAALRAEILEGRIRPGTRLPASRELARQHGLSRGTIVVAFDQLKAEGYVEGNVGSGTYVRQTLPDDLLMVRRTGPSRSARPRNAQRTLSRFATHSRRLPTYDNRPTRAFRANVPALDLFPTSLWAQIAGRRARGATAAHLLGTDPLGYGPLREAVADYLRASRGVAAHAGQVAIVSGVQEALDLASRLLLDPGDRVCVEDPGYVGATRVFEAHGATVVPLPVDDEGMVAPDARHSGARLAYVTPAHQLPLGISMSLPRRLQLLEWARRTRAMVFEDDYDSEYRYEGRPLPALQGLDRHGVVLFAGSFSKVLFPALRLGYLVVPDDLIEPIAAMRSITHRHSPVLDQIVLHEFMSDGHFGRHVRRMREIYAERLTTLIERSREQLSGLLAISGVEAGLQTAGRLERGIDGAAVTRAAAERNVEVVPLSGMCRLSMAQDGLLLGFAAVDAREITRGVRELAMALDAVARNRRRGGVGTQAPRGRPAPGGVGRPAHPPERLSGG